MIAATSPWMTADEAAKYLSLSKHALYVAVQRGQIRAHRLGEKRLRFRREDLDRAIKPRGKQS